MQSVVSLGTSAQFVLYDDDDFNCALNDNNNQSALNGDTGEDIPSPDDPTVNATTLLQPNDILCNQTVTSNCNVFALAYLRPVYDVADPRDDHIFQANIE